MPVLFSLLLQTLYALQILHPLLDSHPVALAGLDEVSFTILVPRYGFILGPFFHSSQLRMMRRPHDAVIILDVQRTLYG